MLKVPYQYVESEVAPSLSFISRAIGIGYVFLGILGISFIIRLGELYMGLGCIAGGIVFNIQTKDKLKEE